MFTGLIEQVGTLLRIERRGPDARLVVQCTFDSLTLGESVAVDGACLTVCEVLGQGFVAMASTETLSRTTLGRAGPGTPVHLERALALGARMGGHIVAGHVDAVGHMLDKRARGQALEVTYELPQEIAGQVAPKGSIAIDGVSLTVNGVEPGAFKVMLVPYTQGETHLTRKRPGDPVNLESDVLAKYVARALGLGGAGGDPRNEKREGGVSIELLLKQGFVR
jgi:riboflavin synthase